LLLDFRQKNQPVLKEFIYVVSFKTGFINHLAFGIDSKAFIEKA